MGASLAEELTSALEGVTLSGGDGGAQDAVVESSHAPEAEAAPADSGGSSARDSAGRFTSKEASAPAEQQATQEAQAQAPVASTQDGQQQTTQDPQAASEARSVMAPPATWSAPAKAVYAQLPEVARREIIKREKDYNDGLQKNAEQAKGYWALMNEIQPYLPMIRSENGTPQGAIRDLLQTSYRLRTGTPQERGQLVMQIAQRFGADISPYIGPQAQDAAGQQQPDIQNHVSNLVQQLVAPHLQKIQQWEQGQMTAQQQQAQQMEQEVSSQIEAFQNATNEDGTLKHLYFENVRPLMSAYFANGQAKDLEQAYEMACWANPEVRTSLIADQQRQMDAQRLAEAKRKAQDAGRAGFNVSGQGGTGIAGATQNSLRDELSSQLDAALGGARV